MIKLSFIIRKTSQYVNCYIMSSVCRTISNEKNNDNVIVMWSVLSLLEDYKMCEPVIQTGDIEFVGCCVTRQEGNIKELSNDIKKTKKKNNNKLSATVSALHSFKEQLF